LSKLELKVYPEKCLRIKTKIITDFNADLSNIAQSMSKLMYINQGIGLASTQVGLDVSLVVIDIGDGIKVFINPEIVEKAKKETVMEEGCLSLPKVIVKVFRPEEITIKYQDLKGNFFTNKYNGLMAKVLQHEIDHLNAKVIIDYLDPVRRFFVCNKLKYSKNLF